MTADTSSSSSNTHQGSPVSYHSPPQPTNYSVPQEQFELLAQLNSIDPEARSELLSLFQDILKLQETNGLDPDSEEKKWLNIFQDMLKLREAGNPTQKKSFRKQMEELLASVPIAQPNSSTWNNELVHFLFSVLCPLAYATGSGFSYESSFKDLDPASQAVKVFGIIGIITTVIASRQYWGWSARLVDAFFNRCSQNKSDNVENTWTLYALQRIIYWIPSPVFKVNDFYASAFKGIASFVSIRTITGPLMGDGVAILLGVMAMIGALITQLGVFTRTDVHLIPQKEKDIEEEEEENTMLLRNPEFSDIARQYGAVGYLPRADMRL